MAQYPAATTNTYRNATKADTASSTSLGSATVSADSGVGGSYGSWYQIIASTAVESYITSIAVHYTTAGASGDLPVYLQLAMGGAGSEVVKWERIIPFPSSAANLPVIVPLDVPFRVTASKRIAARVQVQSATSRDFSVRVYGLPISQTEGN